jgi:hypothetical protein
MENKFSSTAKKFLTEFLVIPFQLNGVKIE